MASRPQLIRQILTEILVPMVHAEGGTLYLTTVHEREVSIHLAGRFAGSPGSVLIFQELALPLIESVAPGTIVHWASGRILPPAADELKPGFPTPGQGAFEEASHEPLPLDPVLPDTTPPTSGSSPNW